MGIFLPRGKQEVVVRPYIYAHQSQGKRSITLQHMTVQDRVNFERAKAIEDILTSMVGKSAEKKVHLPESQTCSDSCFKTYRYFQYQKRI